MGDEGEIPPPSLSKESVPEAKEAAAADVVTAGSENKIEAIDEAAEDKDVIDDNMEDDQSSKRQSLSNLFQEVPFLILKSALRINKVRLETIKKKRNAVENFLKKDIADLLKNDLDYNAYGRAEGLTIEQNQTACYKFIEQFSLCISMHVSIMQKQRYHVSIDI
ncbi:uncharacterized protein LOC120217984 [Hibiscus syriacus]|uniref:uncharacterized protein LOC120217984 n=1 Tax=Hibiscus syriacus TaxID=106335 RepID=UPI001922E48F|nr:uncharacterized protein LOC120217984 [Hibiscus syriacus]